MRIQTTSTTIALKCRKVRYNCQTKLCFVILVKRKAHPDHRFRMTEATQAVGMKGTKNMQSEMILNLSTVKCILGGSSFEQFYRWRRPNIITGAEHSSTDSLSACICETHDHDTYTHGTVVNYCGWCSHHSAKCNTLPIQRIITFNQHNYNGFFTPITVNWNQS